MVGGISRSVVFQGCRMDIGGHRFFTKVPEVEALWHEILDGDLLVRRRMSRIYYRDSFFDYPLRPAQRAAGPGIDRGGSGRGELPSRPALPDRRREHLRRLGQQPFRTPPLRDLLQDLHREGLGHAVLGDQRGVGRPAHQEPRPDDRGQERVPRQRDPRRRGRHQPHRALPLPASRTRA